MKRISNYRKQGMSSHILGGKRRTPVKDGTQTILQAEIRIDKSLFFMDQNEQIDQSVKAATDKNNKRRPRQRAAHKII
jgi:hypothetical protein